MEIDWGKWAFALAKPSNLLLAAFVLGALSARWRAGRMLLAAAVAAVLLVTALRLGDRALARLEEPWRATPLPASIAGIVVLGGGSVLRPAAGEDARMLVLRENVERVLAPLWLRDRYPNVPLLFTGGGAGLALSRLTEAEHVAWLWDRLLGQAPVAYESGSSNTRDNAVHSRALVQPGAGEPWLLVTSAAHMTRAVATFERAGWTVVPYAVDFRTRDDDRLPSTRLDWIDQIARLDRAVYEWLGLLVYRLRGWA